MKEPRRPCRCIRQRRQVPPPMGATLTPSWTDTVDRISKRFIL